MIPSARPRMTERGVRSSWLTSARNWRRRSSDAWSSVLIALNARATERKLRGPRSVTRAVRSPASIRCAASTTSTTGAAKRRSTRPPPLRPTNASSKIATEATRRMGDAGCSASALLTSQTAMVPSANARKTKPSRSTPARRINQRPPRRRAQPGGPCGGNGSPSGHQGGRRPGGGPVGGGDAVAVAGCSAPAAPALTGGSPRGGSRRHRPWSGIAAPGDRAPACAGCS